MTLKQTQWIGIRSITQKKFDQRAEDQQQPEKKTEQTHENEANR